MNRTIFAALLALACAPAYAEPAPRLYLTTETTALAGMREGGRAAGISSDMVRAMMKRAGIAYAIDVLPWKRAYSAALERSDACVYAATRTPARESQFKWVGPVGEAEWMLMGRAGRRFDLRNLDDARRYRIGTYNGDARDLYLRERGFDVDSAPNDMINPRKLMLGRIDLWAASLRPNSPALASMGYGGKIVPVLVFNRVHLYVACNRAVPDALVTRMNAALAAMERDGSARAIRHGKADNGGKGGNDDAAPAR